MPREKHGEMACAPICSLTHPLRGEARDWMVPVTKFKLAGMGAKGSQPTQPRQELSQGFPEEASIKLRRPSCGRKEWLLPSRGLEGGSACPKGGRDACERVEIRGDSSVFVRTREFRAHHAGARCRGAHATCQDASAANYGERGGFSRNHRKIRAVAGWRGGNSLGRP